MKIEILGSTNPGYVLPIRTANIFAGREAGICYMKDDISTLFSESEEKSMKRATLTKASGHHSVFGHVSYNFSLEGIPKIIAMILNNEKDYNTSEKSARYTKMEVSDEEKVLYEKWINLFKDKLSELYPTLTQKHLLKLSMENARYLISVFTPSTSLGHTLDYRQLNYILHWMNNFIRTAPDNSFNTLLRPQLMEFVNMFSDFYDEELFDGKNRSLSLFSDIERVEEWGENYCCSYEGSFAELAQAQRHRTLKYEIKVPDIKAATFYVPAFIRETNLEESWLIDIKSLAHKYPQGMLVKITERGTAEDFILKCKERLCGAAQLEIALQTNSTLNKYVENTRLTNKRVHEFLLPYANKARCASGYSCKAPCSWGAKNALTRLV